jgi:hypothetical protein
MPEIGGIRLYGLAKYLPEHGWNPIILTPVLPGEPDPRFHVIQTSYDDVKFTLEETFEIEPKRNVK